MSNGPLPLDDIRIVSLEQYAAGPFATLQLADMGAEVIKIEYPEGGDVGRHVPPGADDGSSLFFETFNRNKRSMTLDVTTPGGREVLEDLVAVSDVVFANVRGDLAEKLAIRYEDLAHINPRIVSCTLSGYGRTGPRAKDPGYDYLLQGLCGWMSVTGEPGTGPQKTGFSVIDYSTGLVAALSIMIGVHTARRTGVGGDADVSLFDTAIALIGYPATWAMGGYPVVGQTASSAHPSIVPFQNFRTSDGWVVVACAKEKFFRNLCGALDHPEWGEDPCFSDFGARRHNQQRLIAQIEEVMATRSTDEWLAIFQRAGVPAGPINDIPAALADPQTVARQSIVTTESEQFGTVWAPGSPVRFGDSRIHHHPAPYQGTANRAVLEDLLDYDHMRIEQLAANGAFGRPVTVEQT